MKVTVAIPKAEVMVLLPSLMTFINHHFSDLSLLRRYLEKSVGKEVRIATRQYRLHFLLPTLLFGSPCGHPRFSSSIYPTSIPPPLVSIGIRRTIGNGKSHCRFGDQIFGT